MNKADLQRKDVARSRRRGHEQSYEHSSTQARSFRQPASYKEGGYHRTQSSASPAADKREGGFLSSSGNDENAEANSSLLESLKNPRQTRRSVVKYTAAELLALRDSKLVQVPTTLSAFTPLRPGSQAKIPDLPPGTTDFRNVRGNGSIGLDTSGKTSKDIVLAPQRPLDQSSKGLNSSQRVFGVPRASAGGSLASFGAPADTSLDLRALNGYSAKGIVQGTSGANVRVGQGRFASASAGGSGGQPPARRPGNHESSKLDAASWRSSGQAKSPLHPQKENAAAASDEHTQPEWMDDEMVFDESQSVKKMQDIEEWKRRMKEGAGEPGLCLNGSSNLRASVDADPGAMRGSRFLRLFSSGETVAGTTGTSTDIKPSQATNTNIPAATDDGIQSGDQLSKLFKVLGNKVSVGGHSVWISSTQADSPVPSATGEGSVANPADLTEANTQGALVDDGNCHMASQSPDLALLLQAASLTLRNDEKTAPIPGNPLGGSLNAPAAAISPAASALAHQQKPASPAPINEALRGIVPTSVFRKSVQNGSGASAGAKRPESSPSTRSATPARSLPTWLVELSRGRPSPSAGLSDPQMITNETLGTNDLVDTLERGFPALPIKSRALDNQSISSLSVQASIGVPSEANDISLRRGSIDTANTERQADSSQPEGKSAVPLVNGSEQPEKSAAYAEAHAASAAHPVSETLQTPSGTAASVGPTSAPDFSQMQQTMPPPPAMMGHGMPPPPPPHMMMQPPPNSNIIPGMIHPSAMPPMHMLPPHPHGFPGGMVYGMGMVPPPPPPMSMFGGMPPVSVPMAQMSGMPGPMNEHQQMMLMKMMMSDMPLPPAVMYGQMASAPPHLPPAPAPAPARQGQGYPGGLPYPGMPAGVSMATQPANGQATLPQPDEHNPQ
ncbi:hypothetical protein GGI12_002593 [Dipsacomyces acuminosporus]|nr:hypothetical protein GGI12_002593 [Dipsacomyces acuminosporus]